MHTAVASTPDLTVPSTKIDDIVGPCPGCGQRHAYSEAERRQMVETDAVLESISPDLHAVIRAVGQNVYCIRCINQLQEASADARRAMRADNLTRRTYRDGLIPGIARDMRFSGSKPEIEATNETIWDVLRAYPLEKNIWLCGDPGVGKTYAARCVLNQYLDQGRSAAEVSAHRLDEIGRGWKPEQELQPYARVAVLLIEDIDKPRWHAEGVSALWRLCDMRATAKLRLIVTANKDKADAEPQLLAAAKDNDTVVYTLWERMRPIRMMRMGGQSLRG